MKVIRPIRQSDYAALHDIAVESGIGFTSTSGARSAPCGGQTARLRQPKVVGATSPSAFSLK